MSGGNVLDFWDEDEKYLISLGHYFGDHSYKYKSEIEIQHEDPIEEKEDLNENGFVPILGGKSISVHTLDKDGIQPSEWRWALHKAEEAISESGDGRILEEALVRQLLLLGRPYAVSRYSRREKIPYSTAITATMPYGFAALVGQYVAGLKLDRTPQQRIRMREALCLADSIQSVTAYRRARIIQSAVHELAYENDGPVGISTLPREGTRIILSVARLRYSCAELDVRSFHQLWSLGTIYDATRAEAWNEGDDHPPALGRHIRHWRLRHLRPLTDLFPYGIRSIIERCVAQNAAAPAHAERVRFVNELALAHCHVEMMRRSGKKSRGWID